MLATGGYGNVFYLSTNAKGCNAHRDLARVQEGRGVRQPLLHADPPDLHPGARRLPVEADADERVAAQRRPHLGAEARRATRARPARSPRTSATTTSSASTRASATSSRATSPRARPRRCATRAAASARAASASTSTSPTRSSASASGKIAREVRQPVRDVRAHHRRGPVQGPDAHLPGLALHDGRAVGGLQPDEHDPRACSCSARRTSPTTARTASAPRALMQGLADGYFVLPYTIGNYLALDEARARSTTTTPRCKAAVAAVEERMTKLLVDQGQAHGRLLPPRARQDHVGVLRHGPQRRRASRRRSQQIPALREEFWKNVDGARRAATSSTSRSRRPAAWPTSSSSAS